MPIQTPFSPSKNPYQINMLTAAITLSSTNGTTSLNQAVVFDFGKVNGPTYWNVVWDHVSTSSATGGMKVNLMDYTNTIILYTFSSNTTTANQTGSTALATTVLITKPTGVVKIGFDVQQPDTTSRQIAIRQSWITVNP